jgi:hypothetical protein
VSYGLIELLFVFGVVLALALWELRSVRKSLRQEKDKGRDDT